VSVKASALGPFSRAAAKFVGLLGIFAVLGAVRGLDARALADVASFPAAALLIPMLSYFWWVRLRGRVVGSPDKKAVESELLLSMCLAAIVLAAIAQAVRGGELSRITIVCVAILLAMLVWLLHRLRMRMSVRSL